MGLFWGNDDVKAKQPQVQKQKQKETDPRFEPLVLENYAGSGYASKEFGYIIRDIQQTVDYNNGFLSKMYKMMQQLLKENEELRSRVESLEKQEQRASSSPLERAI
nr:hypothetical protein [uncultured Selenomonas sp.]